MSLLLVLLLAAVGLALFTAAMSRRIERRFPPVGTFVDIGGYKLHLMHLPAGPAPDLPAIVFLHGASGNLRDQTAAFRGHLEGRAELVFVDRPGHGYSERGGAQNGLPDGQARAIARAMDACGIGRAVICAHSFGSAVAASFALQFPERTIGLVFLAPATHPWPGGVSWYYRLAKRPLLGHLFVWTVTMAAGLTRIGEGTRSVFAPNRRPDDYVERTAPALVLRPKTFRANAIDIANLNDYVRRMAPRYREIVAPTVIITGDRDGIVAPSIHSCGLARDIDESRLIEVTGLGHKPDHVAPTLAVAAVEAVAGRSHDLGALARAAERRIAAEGRAEPPAPENQIPEAPSEPI